MSTTPVRVSTVMGPEGSVETRSGTMPPSWDGVMKPYRLYHEELMNWKDFTTLKPERHAPAVIIRLSGEPQRLALTVPREKRIQADGLDTLITKFDEVYSSTEEQDLYFFYKELCKFRRRSEHSIADFISGFTARAEKLTACAEVTIPSKLLAMMLIDHASLTNEEENNLFGASGGQLDFTKVSRALKLVMKDSESKNLETGTNNSVYISAGSEKDKRGNFNQKRKKFCRYCKKRSHNINECWLLKKKSEKSNDESWEFPVFTTKEAYLVNPIVDSAAGSSLIGIDTLKRYAEILQFDAEKLPKFEPMMKTHRFGYYGEEIKSLYSVNIPLPLKDRRVTVRADLLPGAHPFLLGGDTQERMRATLDYASRTLCMMLGNIPIKVKLIKPDKHLLIPLNGTTPSYITSGSSKSDIDLKRLHANTGHASFDNMKTLLKHADLWDSALADPLRSIISDCTACLEARKPVPAPVVDIHHIEPVFNDEVELDIVYFHGHPFLHCECKKTKLSSTVQLENREAKTLWNSFIYSWVFTTAHGPPNVLQGDPEFDNKVFKERSTQWGIKLKVTAAKAKWQQGIVERGNGILRAIFNRIDKERPELPLQMKVAHATFAKSIMFGNKTASSYELVFRRSFPVAGRCTVLPKNLFASFTRSVARRKIGVALKSRARKLEGFMKNEYIYFYRKDFGGFVGPAKVVDICEGGNMKVCYKGREYSVSRDMAKRIQQPLEYWLDEESSTEPEKHVEPSSEAENSTLETQPALAATDAGLKLRLHNYRPGDPTPEPLQPSLSPLTANTPSPRSVPPNDGGPATRTRSRTNASSDFPADLKIFYADDNMASEKDIKKAFSAEFDSWKCERVFEPVPYGSAPKGSNIITSHVVYLWKNKGTPRERLKARIVPHGNRDKDRELLRSDSPSMKPEVMRMVCSFAVDMGYDLKAMDIKTAFLQTGELKREVYMKPPKEAQDTKHLWRLLKTAYGLVDGPIRWYRHSREVFLRFGLIPSKIDPALYYLPGTVGKKHHLIVATQVDDFLYTGRADKMRLFEKYNNNTYKVGQISEGSFIFNGVNIKYDYLNECIILSQPELKKAEGISLSPTRAKEVESDASTMEENHFRSITGTLLWYGTQTVPYLQLQASLLARKVPSLQVKHLKRANSTLKQGANLNSSIRIKKGNAAETKLMLFTDASHAADGGVHSQEGAIIFKHDERVGSCFPLLWGSRKIKRVVKSTLAAETIAAVNGYDDGIYVQQLMKELFQKEFPLKLHIDSKSLFDLLTSTHLDATTEKRLKIDIAIIRQAFEQGELSSVAWVPRTLQLADSLTKANHEAAQILQRTLNEGHFLCKLQTEEHSKSSQGKALKREKDGS